MIEQLFPPEVVAISATAEMWSARARTEEIAAVASAVPKRRREYVAGRACARKALAILGVRDFPLLNDSDGVPIWPESVIGSLAHCEGYCGVAVARKGRIGSLGFDVEPAAPLPIEVRDLVCCESELAWIKHQPPPPFGDWFRLFFCAKESAFKAIFPIVRLKFDFWNLEVRIRPQSNEFAVKFPRSLGIGTTWQNGRFTFSKTHVLTGVTIVQPTPLL